jgi:transcriptional regulator with XRE-family HTH domain
MIDPGEITAARQALGRLLARYRKAAGFNQHELAPRTHYGRSTIANVETGRQNVPPRLLGTL